MPFPVQHRRQTKSRCAQSSHNFISKLFFIRRDEAAHVMAQCFSAVFLEQNIEHVDQSARLALSSNDGQKIETGSHAARDRSFDDGIWFTSVQFRPIHYIIVL